MRIDTKAEIALGVIVGAIVGLATTPPMAGISDFMSHEPGNQTLISSPENNRFLDPNSIATGKSRLDDAAARKRIVYPLFP